MAAEWEEATLDCLYDFSSGLSKPRSEFGSGHPFLSFMDIFDNYFVPTVLSERVRSTEKEREALSVRRGDVFLTRTSETVDELGMSCVALRDIPHATFNGFAKRLRPKPQNRVVPEFAGYFFRSAGFRAQVYGLSSLSTRASLNNEMLARLVIRYPPESEQKRIAGILKALDDKIELNRRMSETLEAMARALFKSWFVDFEPVRAKAEGRRPGLPETIAKLFPDSFEGSAVGEIPKGWGLGALGEFVEQVRDNENPMDSPDQLFQHFSIPAFDDGSWPVAEFGASIRSQKSRVPQGVVLLSKLNPEIERVWVVDIKPSDLAVCSTEFLVLAPRAPYGRSYAYCVLRTPSFRQELEGLVTGTSKSHQRVHASSVLALRSARPPAALVKSFQQIAEPALARALAARRESRTLSALREAMLPKLITGELSTAAIARGLQ